MKWTLFGNHYSTGNISSPGAQASWKTSSGDCSVPITQYQPHHLKLINSSSTPSFYHIIPIEHDSLRISCKTVKSMASHVDCVILQNVTMHAAGGKYPNRSDQWSFAEQGCAFTHNALLWIHSLVIFVPLCLHYFYVSVRHKRFLGRAAMENHNIINVLSCISICFICMWQWNNLSAVVFIISYLQENNSVENKALVFTETDIASVFQKHNDAIMCIYASAVPERSWKVNIWES